MKKIIFRWTKLVILVYCSIGIAVYYLQDRFIFHPTKIEAGKRYAFTQPFTELNLNYDPETNINIVEFKATGQSPAGAPLTVGPVTLTADGHEQDSGLEKGVILFFHDGRGNIADYAGMSKAITDQGYELWMMDYPGFGKSTGPMDEQRLYDLALVFYKLARSRWKPREIILYGQGFGTGIAAELASVRDCRRLILEQAYYSMTARFRRFLFLYPLDGRFLHYHLPTHEYLQNVTAPVSVINGSHRLKECLKPGKDEFIKKEDPF